MTSKFKSIPKNLYTLNEDSSSKPDDAYLINIIQSANKNKNSQQYYNQPDDSDSQSEKLNLDEIQIYQQENNKEEIQKLTSIIQSLQQKINALKVANKELKSSYQMAELRNKKHEQRQREIITKLSHQQVANQQLEYEIKKCSEEISRLEECKKIIDTRNVEASDSMKRMQEQQLLFINSFKKISDAIAKCRKVEDFLICTKKFQEFICKNLTICQKFSFSDPNLEEDSFVNLNNQFSLDLSFQLAQMSTLRSKMTAMEQKYKKMIKERDTHLENEKIQKKRIVAAYNDKLTRLKQQSEELKSRIDQRQEDLQGEIKKLRVILSEKNDVINQLKSKIDNLREEKNRYVVREPSYDKDQEYDNSFIHKKNASQCSRGSRVKARKKSFYIGDGEQSNTDYMINELQSKIQKLEIELVNQLEQ